MEIRIRFENLKSHHLSLKILDQDIATALGPSKQETPPQRL
jgi:hypothetical protein